jgi:hypothetical protein
MCEFHIHTFGAYFWQYMMVQHTGTFLHKTKQSLMKLTQGALNSIAQSPVSQKSFFVDYELCQGPLIRKEF